MDTELEKLAQAVTRLESSVADVVSRRHDLWEDLAAVNAKLDDLLATIKMARAK